MRGTRPLSAKVARSPVPAHALDDCCRLEAVFRDITSAQCEVSLVVYGHLTLIQRGQEGEEKEECLSGKRPAGFPDGVRKRQRFALPYLAHLIPDPLVNFLEKKCKNYNFPKMLGLGHLKSGYQTCS